MRLLTPVLQQMRVVSEGILQHSLDRGIQCKKNTKIVAIGMTETDNLLNLGRI